ncbi:hypothetical protein J3458_018776 [Metarhizium acridum]|uniref:uncharacterized protein n=1 Tax=Metarhizium acridum TaxID=92637 RepID=UPI001C6AD442|nr:hypothetical protein J3458_018776 [Metarhizium acridum]
MRIYIRRERCPHDLEGVSLWVSGQDGKDFDAVFSGDLLQKLQDTLGGDSCKDKGHGDACYQALHGVLRSADMSVDNGLAKRDFYRLVSRSFLVWRLLEDENQHIPQAAASSAGGLDRGRPLTISAEGSSIVVITPTPDPTAPPTKYVSLPVLRTYITNTIKPTRVVAPLHLHTTTHITKDDKDYKVGDVVINLDKNEATRISDMIGMSGCKDGGHGKKRSLSSGLAAAGCAVPAVLQQARPGGALQELRGLQPRGPPLRFQGADIVRAANEALDVARELAPLIAMSPGLIDHLAMMVFALGIEEFADHVAIETP